VGNKWTHLFLLYSAVYLEQSNGCGDVHRVDKNLNLKSNVNYEGDMPYDASLSHKLPYVPTKIAYFYYPIRWLYLFESH